ncbi:hypothetical protein AA0229_1347 [Gluconobacter cerinus NRIC 0229]|nr:hypothetical protein AA0229_1347 [Gluconobacter cerinus NRIC 0229]
MQNVLEENARVWSKRGLKARNIQDFFGGIMPVQKRQGEVAVERWVCQFTGKGKMCRSRFRPHRK